MPAETQGFARGRGRGAHTMKATPFLMFQGQARDALALYREAFPDYEELLLQEHPKVPQAGQVAMARIRVGGLEIMLNDSPPIHGFTFTPSTSTFIECDDEAQLRALAESSAKAAR
jgi:predicted 3-demethylubiquinone-9 3-methyltransferase (glyoxalase superfamily)